MQSKGQTIEESFIYPPDDGKEAMNKLRAKIVKNRYQAFVELLIVV
ncbi:MAG: hypothetical protein ACI9WT_001314 [Flavobacterium sp.]|jgi:hypothetical protein